MRSIDPLLIVMCALPLATQTEWRLPDLPELPRIGARARVAEGVRQGISMAPSQVVRLAPSWVRSMQVVQMERPCAVPLTNMLRPSVRIPPMPRIQPPPAGNLHMKHVQVPAPSCGDVDQR